MADRGITNQALIDAIEATAVIYYECVEINLTLNSVDTTYLLTNAPRDVVIGSDTYRAFGQLMDISVIEENATFEIGTLNISLSGIDPYEPNSGDAFLEVMLRETTEYIDREVVVQRAYFNADSTYIDSIEVFRGYITGAAAQHDDSGESSVGIEVANHWADFERVTGRRTNDNSQQFFFSGDVGMQYAVEVQKDITWKP